MKDDSSGRSFSFILCDGFSMLCLSAAVDVLRASNLITGQVFYTWNIISHDGQPARASNGMEIACAHSVDTLPPAEITFVVASSSTNPPGSQRIISALRTAGRRGAALGALSTGTHLLAQAGQLEGRRCTIHWQNRAVFAETFPAITCTGAVYEIDDNRYTAAGGTTGMDLMLALIRQDFGADIANKVANNFQYEHIRNHDDRQRVSIEPNLSGKSEKLKRVAELMADNLEEPLNAEMLARAVHLSVRQIERLFLKHLNSTPGRYYMRLRLDRAQQLLRQTNMPILEVALATGFTSHSYFAQSYRMQFGRAPSAERL
ncbi:MAG: GlxA family transcriptional regulator [Ahrensia sp.]